MSTVAAKAVATASPKVEVMVASLLDVTKDIFSTMVDRSVEFGEPTYAGPQPTANVVATVGFAGTLSGYVSLASIAAAASFPLAVYLLQRPDQPEILWLDALVAAAIIWLHRANIRRLLNGTESRFGRRTVPPAHP